MSCVRLTRFELRRNLASIWTSTNPILLSGEPGVETDTGQMKIGNGVTPWNLLPYVGAGGDVFDHALVRNIGMHAYINDFTASYTFDNVYNTLTFYVTIFGNGVYYDMNFSYSPSLTMNSYSFSSINTGNYNNSSTSGQTNLSFAIPFTVLSPASGDYAVTITINTRNTGGIGNGSYITKSIPIFLQPSDSMGNPSIIAPYTQLGITGPTTTISGIKYYTNGAYIPVPQYGITFNNIYNVVDNRSFYHLTLSQSSYGSYFSGSLVYSNGSGGYLPFPRTNQNVSYFNGEAFNVFITGFLPILANLTNAISKQNVLTFFPTSDTWGGNGQPYIGYTPAVDEVTIRLNQGGTSSSAVASQERKSIMDIETNPDTPSIGNINAFDSSSLTKYDPAFQPFDNNFYASDFTFDLNTIYILPRVATFTPGTKYLMLKVNTQAAFKAFNILFGSSSTGIVKTFVYWTTSGTNTWYDGSISFTSPGGCLAGYGINAVSIQLNTAADETYTPGGDVYINIKFTGNIKITEILLQ